MLLGAGRNGLDWPLNRCPIGMLLTDSGVVRADRNRERDSGEAGVDGTDVLTG